MLQRRQKWYFPRRYFAIGDLTLVIDEKAPRGRWPMGLVEEVFPDSNDHVRSVRVKTASSVCKRDIKKLCLLEEVQISETWFQELPAENFVWVYELMNCLIWTVYHRKFVALKGLCQPVRFAGVESCGGHFRLYRNCSSQSSGFFWGSSALCEHFTVRCVKTSLHHRISIYIWGFFLLNQVCAQKTQFCCGRVNCRDLRQNVVGRQRMKINKTILLRESRRRLILVFSETPIANLRRFLVSTLASEVASQTFISTRIAAVFPRFLWTHCWTAASLRGNCKINKLTYFRDIFVQDVVNKFI